MKRILLIVLCAAMLLSVSGCVQNEYDSPTSSLDSAADMPKTAQTSASVAPQEEVIADIDVESFIGDFIDVDDFEKKLNRAIADFLPSLKGDNSLEEWKVTDFELNDVSDAVYDQFFSCKFGPNSIYGLMGSASCGKVTSVFTVLTMIDFSLDTDERISILPALMIPTALYKSDCKEYENLFSFEREILLDGKESEERESSTLTIDDIDYKITVSQTMLGYTIDAKRLWNTKCEELADEYLSCKDFDKAVYYYGKANSEPDKIKEAYYRKAEAFLDRGDPDSAEEFFNRTQGYKDSDVRLLEVYYCKGVNSMNNNDHASAIDYFSMAGEYSDAKAKYKECCFKLGEQYSDEHRYHEAISCFENAADHSGAQEKYKEVCYLYAEQQLVLGHEDEAAAYFIRAGNYKDAATRMESYFYDKGCEYLNSNQYLNAVNSFKQNLGYSDAKDKYKQACYLYGEELLAKGSVESAKEYFYSAGDYEDASTKIQKYYYEKGEALLQSQDHLSAAEMYSNAGTYSDAGEKILECYYQYGKQQLDLNYTTDAVAYLSKCRGYKDTDDILLSYYYSEAANSVNTFVKLFAQGSFAGDIENAYNNAISYLNLCEGYNDSKTLLKVVDKLYTAWSEMPDRSNYEASLYEMNAGYSGDAVTITQDGFMGQGCNLSLTCNVSKNTFEADITNMFNSSVREYDARNVISALIVLFSDIQNTGDLDAKFSDANNWTISGEKETFSMKYGGYSISVQTQTKDNYYIDCHISVQK